MRKSDDVCLDEMVQLEGILNYKFKDKSYLLNALVHKSFSNENPDYAGINNEKLELLGDSVLGLVTVEYLYERFSNLNEGEIVKIKSALVSESMLFEVAKNIRLGSYIYFSKGEHINGGKERPSTIADAMEAIIGAIYLDGGLQSVKAFFLPILTEKVDSINSNDKVIDYKTALQEYTQTNYKSIPKYRLEGEIGPDHQKKFFVSIMLKGLFLGEGIGKSKKDAEQKAARIACEYLKIKTESLF